MRKLTRAMQDQVAEHLEIAVIGALLANKYSDRVSSMSGGESATRNHGLAKVPRQMKQRTDSLT
jgi:hypothetical protein